MERFNTRLATIALLAVASIPLLGSGKTEAASISSYQYTTDDNIANAAGVHSIYLDPSSSQDAPGAITLPGVFNLGTFTTNPLLPGETVSYQNTPFSVDLKVAPSGNGTVNFSSDPTVYSDNISGLLNGNLTDGSSTLYPTITSITGSGNTPPFGIEDLKFNLPLIAAPNGDNNGTTMLTVSVDPSGSPLPAPAPEPTSVAAFAAALAGWAWMRRRSRIRNASV